MNYVPSWINQQLFKLVSLDEVKPEVFQQINKLLEAKTNDNSPDISIVISAWNEELNILRCLDTLAKQKTSWSYEIIVVDNNSKDRTKESINKLRVKYLFEGKQGCGPARQTGQENAKGQYILLADADAFYPPDWISLMMKELVKKDVVCVYGNHSFLRKGFGNLIVISLYERIRNLLKILKHFKRPFLNCLGMSMGYVKKYGLEVGFIERNIRGEDGRLAYGLMKYGKFHHVKNKRATVWTGDRTLSMEGGLLRHFLRKVKKESSSVTGYFVKMKDHDPKTTDSNENYSARAVDNVKN